MHSPLNSTTTPFRLGFDGGGTKTRAVVIDAANRILGAGESGASNPYSVGMDAALDHIEAAADGALAEAKLTRAQISGWGLGLGGVCSPTESADVENALRARLGEGPKIVAVEDVVVAWSGAFGGEAGSNPRAVCIAGTGANCWGKNAQGQTANADGAGPLLGDRGSGYWIGERALRHAARVADGVAEPDDFAAAVMAHFNTPDLKALIRLVYSPGFERSNMASLVRTVIQHTQSPSALEILTDAGTELALTSLAVLRQLSGQGPIRGEVTLIGGVLAHAAPVKTAFTAMLQERAPLAHFVEAQYEPAIGAALLC